MNIKTLFPPKSILLGGLLGLLFVAILFFLPSPNPPTIDSTSPKPAQLNVLLNSSLTVNFSTPINKRTQKKLALDTNPVVIGIPTWSDDGKTLTLTPTTPLIKNTTYYVDLIFNNVPLHSFSFITNPYDAADLKIQGQNQAIDDQIFGNAWNQNLEKYPWYPALPIDTPAYYIFFDFDTKIFDIHLKNKPISSESQTQIESAALDSLKKIGVPDNLLEYNVIID